MYKPLFQCAIREQRNGLMFADDGKRRTLRQKAVGFIPLIPKTLGRF